MPALTINGTDRHARRAGRHAPLWALRDVAGLTGTKFGCGQAAVRRLHRAPRRPGDPLLRDAGRPRPARRSSRSRPSARTRSAPKVQDAWRQIDVVQCGYCQSGQVMSATALLQATPKPSDADIDNAMSGNICRCGTYGRIRAAIKIAAAK
jgi:isoquinoline 1-oxidoreductase alpha subunit